MADLQPRGLEGEWTGHCSQSPFWVFLFKVGSKAVTADHSSTDLKPRTPGLPRVRSSGFLQPPSQPLLQVWTVGVSGQEDPLGS